MIPAVFSRFLACTALVILPLAMPNLARAQDLGIDCHVPRTTLDGKTYLRSKRPDPRAVRSRPRYGA